MTYERHALFSHLVPATTPPAGQQANIQIHIGFERGVP